MAGGAEQDYEQSRVDSMSSPGASLAEVRAKPREVMPSPQFSEGAGFTGTVLPCCRGSAFSAGRLLLTPGLVGVH